MAKFQYFHDFSWNSVNLSHYKTFLETFIILFVTYLLKYGVLRVWYSMELFVSHNFIFSKLLGAK